MTTFDEIAKQMKNQGMSQAQIAKWGRLGGAEQTSTPTPTVSVAQSKSKSTTTTPTKKKSSKKRTGTPSKSKIAEYWLFDQMPKCSEDMDEETRFAVYDSLTAFQKKLAIIDWGEPCCWACGMWKDTDNDITDPTETNPLKSWDGVKWLEICHIVPHSLGGNEEVDNLVLLCKSCHKMAPNVKNPERMKQFITDKKSESSIQMEVIEKMDFSKADVEYLVENSEQLFSYIYENTSFHFGQGIHLQDLLWNTEDWLQEQKQKPNTDKN